MARLQDYICFNCAEKMTQPLQQCPHCGYDNRHRQNGPGELGDTTLRNQYYIGRTLGRGGFGITYIGHDLNLERKVAIKEFFPQNASRDTGRYNLQSFGQNSQRESGSFDRSREHALREARRIASIEGVESVVKIYNVLEENDTLYIIMEYIDGETLNSLVERGGPMKPADMYRMMQPIMHALAKIHARGVVHRDISPDNIMQRRQTGETVLLDFGAARDMNIDQGRSTVTLRQGYAPPEQYVENAKLDGRTDEYALCATMYFMLGGKKPPNSNTRLMAEYDTLTDALIAATTLALPDDVETRVQQVLYKGMSLKPENRFGSVEELEKALREAIFEPAPKIPARPKTPPQPRPVEPNVPKKRGVPVLGIAVVALLLVIGVAATLLMSAKEPDPQYKVVVTDLGNGQTQLGWKVDGAKTYDVVIIDADGERFELIGTESVYAVGPSEQFADCKVEVIADMGNEAAITFHN